MYYYIIGNRIRAFEFELNSDYNYQKLDAEQSDFYEAHPDASINEVLAMQLRPPYNPTLEDFKNSKIAELTAAYHEQISSGYLDIETGYTLFIDESAMNDYHKMKSNIFDYDDMDIVPIGTYTGWHEVTKAVAYALLVRYGKYTMPLVTKLKVLITAVTYLETIEAVQAVTW